MKRHTRRNPDIPNGAKFDPLACLSTRQHSISKEISLQKLELPESHPLKIVGQKAFPLFTQACCHRIQKELLRYHTSTKVTLGPTLAESRHHLPFTYEALSHSKLAEILSAMAGFDLDICYDYFEISQFATRKQLHEEYSNIANWRKIPYTFICMVQLDQEANKDLDKLPTGMATILEGKLTSNLSSLQLATNPAKNDFYKLNLMIVAKPADIIDYENQRIMMKLGRNHILQITYHEDDKISEEDVGKYAVWLDKHYDKLLSK